MSQQPITQPDTLKGMARKYGMSKDTLKSMLKLYPEVYNLVYHHINAKKRLLPPAVVEQVYKTLGYPEM